MQQRTISFLRKALPVAFFGFIVLIALSYRRHGEKPHSTLPPVTSTLRNERPQVVLDNFDDTQTIAGKVVSRIRARRTIGYVSGWYTLEDVHVTLFRNDGNTYEIFCDQAQFQPSTRQAEVRGRVRLESSDGIKLSTDVLNYDGEQVSNKSRVNFQVGRWSGSAGGVELKVQEQLVRINDGVEGVMMPAVATEPPIHFRSNGVTFRRASGDGSLDGDVVIRRERESFRADNVQTRVDPKTNILQALNGGGNVVVRLERGSAVLQTRSAEETIGSGEGQITAAQFVSQIDASGAIQAVQLLGGVVPAHAVFSGPPRRDVSAKTLRIGFQGKAVSDFVAEGGASLQELGPVARVLDAERITMQLNAQTRQPSSAFAQGNFHYRDPKNDATGQQATYDITGDRLVLSAAANSAPSITSEGNTLKANMIEVAPKEGVLKGNGAVVARLVSQKGSTSASDTAIFPNADAPVFVNSDAVVMRNQSKLASFSGNVRAWQDTNSLFAAELKVSGAGETLQATGGVRAILYNAKPGTSSKQPILAKGSQLTAKKNDRRIDLEGGVEITDEGRVMTAVSATFFLDARRRIDHVEAVKNLVLTEKASGRKATGDKADYRVQQRVIYIDGSPAVVSDPKGVFKGKQIVFDLNKNQVQVASGATQSEGSYTPK